LSRDPLLIIEKLAAVANRGGTAYTRGDNNKQSQVWLSS